MQTNPNVTLLEVKNEELENLGEALLDFSSMADLQVWLEENVSR